MDVLPSFSKGDVLCLLGRWEVFLSNLGQYCYVGKYETAIFAILSVKMRRRYTYVGDYYVFCAPSQSGPREDYRQTVLSTLPTCASWKAQTP